MSSFPQFSLTGERFLINFHVNVACLWNPRSSECKVNCTALEYQFIWSLWSTNMTSDQGLAQTFNIFCRANEEYCATIHDNNVVLAPANPDDEYQVTKLLCFAFEQTYSTVAHKIISSFHGWPLRRHAWDPILFHTYTALVQGHEAWEQRVRWGGGTGICPHQ